MCTFVYMYLLYKEKIKTTTFAHVTACWFCFHSKCNMISLHIRTCLKCIGHSYAKRFFKHSEISDLKYMKLEV